MIANLLEKISELEQQIATLKAEVEKKEKEKESKSTNKRWRAECGDGYWTITGYGMPDWLYECNRDMDDFHYDTHNYFQTKEEAQRYAKVIEIERQLKKFADEHNDKIGCSNNSLIKRSLCYNYNTQSIWISPVGIMKEPRVIYFSSEGIAKQAIKTIGEEKIKDYLTYEW